MSKILRFKNKIWFCSFILSNPSRGIRTISFFDSNEITLKKIDNPTLIIENLWCVSWKSWKFWNGFMKSNWFILEFFNGFLCFCYQKIRIVSFILRRICMCVHGARDKDMFWFWNQNTGIVVDFWSFKWRKITALFENGRLQNWKSEIEKYLFPWPHIKDLKIKIVKW